MTRFGNTDNEYSRYLTGDVSLGVGDHTVTNRGAVGLITVDDEHYWQIKPQGGVFYQVAKEVCRPCIEVTRPYPGPRTAYMCNCGCKKTWMPTVAAS